LKFCWRRERERKEKSASFRQTLFKTKSSVSDREMRERERGKIEMDQMWLKKS